MRIVPVAGEVRRCFAHHARYGAPVSFTRLMAPCVPPESLNRIGLPRAEVHQHF
jgi:hypothetical protein